MKGRVEGMTLIEVLIAAVIITLIIGSVVVANVNLSGVNGRAQVQALEASAAEGIARKYAGQLPTVGHSVSGPVSAEVLTKQLSPDEAALLKLLNFTLSRDPSGVTLNIYRNDVPRDPDALSLHMEVD